MLKIVAPTLADAEELFAFECDNRAYFERCVNARDPAYYQLDAVKHAIASAASERAAEKSHQFLIKADGVIVGRINLHAVERRYFNRAVLGYRIAQQAGGKGYATQALALLLPMAFEELQFSRIEASVRLENSGSLKVLQRNGFTAFGRANQSMYFNGAWSDLLYFECLHPNGPIKPDLI